MAPRLLIGVLASAIVTTCAWVLLNPVSNEPSFLRQFPLIDTSALTPGNPNKINTRKSAPLPWLFGVPQGSRIYTFKASFPEVVAAAKRESGWTLTKEGEGFALLERPDETLIIRNSRSLLLKWKGTDYHNRYIVSPEEAKRSRISEDVVGWVSVDHDWKGRAGILK